MRCKAWVLSLCFILVSGFASGQTEAQRQVECWRTMAKSGALLNCYTTYDFSYVEKLSEDPAAFEAFGEILAEALRQKNPEVARAAAYTLSRMGPIPTSARQALVAALESQDKWTRVHAAEALSRLRPPVVEPLLKLASDPDGQVRADVAESLGGLCKDRLPAIDPLLTLAADPDPGVRSHAANALGNCSDERGISRLVELFTDVDKQVRSSAAEALRKLAPELGPPAVEALVSALKHGSGDVAGQAAGILGGLTPIPPVARRALVEAAGSQDVGVRRVVAWALGRTQPVEAEPLLSLASDSDPGVRYAAVQALAECPDPRAAPRLAQHLADSDGQVRIAALHGLVKIGPGAADALVTLLEDRTTPKPVRNEVVEALQQAKAVDRQAVGRVIALLENDELSSCAAAVLEGSKDERVPEAMRAYQRRRAQRLWVIIKSGDRGEFFNEFQELSRIAKTPGSGAVEILVEAVGLPNPDAAAQAVRVLTHMHIRPLPPAVRDALVGAASSPAPALRDAVALALSSLEPPPVEPLLKLSSDPELRVRRSAAEALGLCADGRAGTRLTDLLADPDEDVRTTARESLLKLGPAAADALLAALNHANGSALEEVLLLLNSVQDPRAADPLLRFIEDDKAPWGIRLEATMALGKIKPADSRIVERLVALLAPLDSPETAQRAFFAASVLRDLSGGPSDDQVNVALAAYEKRRSAYEAALRARDEGDLVTAGGFRSPNVLIGPCESCGRDSDCPSGMVCRKFRAVGSGETRRLCALPAQVEIRCPR
jgi:HEAT repeat protein